ncbi:hypothetical protein ACUR5C_11545 [Aliikangiella sp. IMCC44653]
MMFNELLSVWSNNQAISLLVWLLIAIVSLYLGRSQAHKLFAGLGNAVYKTLRLWSFSLASAEAKMRIRNEQVLLQNGAQALEKTIEREFVRIADIVQRDLSQYPGLHRKLSESIDKIESSYQESTQAAPLPPAWGEVVETISNLPSNGDPTVVKILANIKKAVDESHQQTLKAYKQSSAKSHHLLSTMQPEWRQISQKLSDVDAKVQGLDECAKNIDCHIQNYADVLASKNSSVNQLSASAFTQFFISGLVLVVAALGGLINFQLIALPMSEMVGGASYIGSMKTSDIAALVIILIEIAMGLFLFECLRITQLFPVISSMDDRLRKRMMIVTFSILFILASIEASLAYMRDLLAMDKEALQHALMNAGTNASVVEAQFRWIPSVGQMIMGFILPFALAFIAIPLESFIHSLRVVLGAVSVALIKVLRVTLRSLGGLAKQSSKILIALYDIVIMIPVSFENLWGAYQQKTDASKMHQVKS